VLDLGESIPTSYQKNPYHMMFEVKYDLNHKAILVTVVYWTFNKKENMYSGIVQMGMYTVRIGFF
jgi:hypothetical protein